MSVLLYEPFHLNSRHWFLALLLALAVHMIIFLSYKSNTDSGVEEFNQKSILIHLKKITFPPKVEPPRIMQPRVEHLPKPKPEPKLKPVVKPKSKIEPKPNIIVKPVKIYEPKVEPIQYDIIQKYDNKQIDSKSSRFNQSLKRNYESQLLAWLERHKKYPNIARRRGQQGMVILEFIINAEGKLLSKKIQKASAHSTLNYAVIKMIEQASPMPPVPKQLQKGQTQFSYTVPVYFKLKK